ncbi:hypothetical protein CC99x_000315 [Candidatus Berkiella cookevillensis]|uniref:Uncharacterized protein n=1 Tax=Candidatus Berkiella cookevillensis TaxID=437022 RepID=A0A0Q9YIH8_9GAMM|nr:hypothetical protein [Candidatus Berkiella cookevillensis]MCS5707337.1 hypothetical protein [Candidatus Berkiella cookevillensis]
MIKEFEFYHGVFFSSMLHATHNKISFQSYSTEDNASYVIDEKIGLYIKYSTKRLSPWRFSFYKRHQDKMLEMKTRFNELLLILVCHHDGIVILNFDEIKQILDNVHEEIEWVSVARTRGKMYTINGSNGKLQLKVARNDFHGKIFTSKY